MPMIFAHVCNDCDFELPTGWGGHTYAVDDQGRRVVCGHPGEDREVVRVTGLSWDEAIKARRTGFANDCVCFSCLSQFQLDMEHDKIVCPTCASSEVRTINQIIGQNCPRCKKGIIERVSPVRWQLDSGWEQLPVPQVVKDLVEYGNSHSISPSLSKAVRLVDSARSDYFSLAVSKLLEWWEGDNLDEEQKDFMEATPKMSDLVSVIMSACPPLAELITIQHTRLLFAEGIDADVLRGIKNYIRKHRFHRVMC